MEPSPFMLTKSNATYNSLTGRRTRGTPRVLHVRGAHTSVTFSWTTLQLLSDLLLARSPAARLPFRSVFNKRVLFLQRARALPRRNNRLVSPLDISSTSGVRASVLGRNIKTPVCRNKRSNRCLTITSDKQPRCGLQIETEEARCRGCCALYSTVSSMLKRFFHLSPSNPNIIARYGLLR